MATPDVLIRDGHAGNTAAIDGIPELDDFLRSNQGSRVKVPNDVDLERLKLRLSDIKTIIIDFPSYADGRGFSVARELRKKYGFKIA